MVYKSNNDNQRRRSNRRAPIGLLVVFSIILLLIVTGIILTSYVKKDISGDRRGIDKINVIEVRQGSSTTEIAELLKENEIIKSPLVFRLYVKYIAEEDGSFNYGDHEVASDMSYDEIIESLKKPMQIELETFSLTIPEGTTALKIAMMLEEKGVCTIDEFIECCNNDVFEVSFFNQITERENKFIKLEGFLFPETYEFNVDATLHEIIKIMLRMFEEKVLDEETQKRIAASGMTLEENIILASIVEKEALGEDIYAQVSGVFHNRLNNPDRFPSLESCTSANHLLGNYIYGVLGYYYNGDIEPYTRNIPEDMWRAYDTYLVRGLIVGAICNPGLNAIKATLNPSDTPYYFFVTDDDHVFYWGATDAEHSANIEAVRRANAIIANSQSSGS